MDIADEAQIEGIHRNYITKKAMEVTGKCSIVYKSTLNYGVWEPYIVELVCEILKGNTGLVVDVGAHIGNYTFIAVDMGYHVIACESNQEWANNLEQCISLNGVTDSVTMLKERVNEHNNVGKILQDSDFEEIFLLKADIEGGEPMVIRGCEELIRKNKIKNLILEISPKYPHIRDKYISMVKFICDSGYLVYDIGLGDKRRRINKDTNHIDSLTCLSRETNWDEYFDGIEYGQTNFYFKKDE